MAAQLSPMMQHYMETKSKYPDCILFYRLGDFYEMFFDDAKTVSRELELTLTGKECGLPERAPMCGVPHHAVDTYLSRLVLLLKHNISDCLNLNIAGDLIEGQHINVRVKLRDHPAEVDANDLAG